MFKRLFILLLALWIPAQAYASIISVTYDSSTDTYDAHFSTDDLKYYTVQFTASDGTVFGPYSYDGINSNGHYYLTCNGAYVMKFYDFNHNLKSSHDIQTTQIQNPTCSSSGGSNPEPIEEPAPGDGSGGTGDGSTTGCDGCQTIREMLACPEWDTYMGEWEAMIRRAVPPPPDWQNVANIMRDTIVPALIDGMVNTVVPAMGDEIDRRLGQVAAPAMIGTPNVPRMDGTEGVTRPEIPQDTTPEAQTYDFDSIPSVEVQPDTTGGIDLLGADPIDSIPHSPEGYMPKPGQESGGFQPMTTTTSNPTPTNQETVEPPAESMPTPGTSSGEPPSPGATTSPPPAPEMPMPN